MIRARMVAKRRSASRFVGNSRLVPRITERRTRLVVPVTIHHIFPISPDPFFFFLSFQEYTSILIPLSGHRVLFSRCPNCPMGTECTKFRDVGIVRHLPSPKRVPVHRKKPAPSEAWRHHARSKAQCGFHLRCSSLWPPAAKCCADKTLCAVTAQLGWSDPTNYFGHGNVLKSGVAPAQSGVLSAPKVIVVPCATSSPADSSENPRVTQRVTNGVICVFHAPFTLRRRIRADA